MPRNSSGTHSLPAGNPVVAGTTVAVTWANGTMTDLSAELSDSLSRSGKGSMTAALKTPDGTVAAPAHAFTNETGSGLYRAASGDIRIAVSGADALKLAAGGTVQIAAVGITLTATTANGFLLLQGNQNATQVSTGANPADVVLASTATRTAGFIAQIQNPLGTGKLGFDYQGLLQLQNTSALQPASIYTAPTLDTNWAAVYGLSYWKDACGMVHFKGAATNNTGGLSSGILSTTPLPANFRPAAATFREFGLPTSAGTVVIGSVSAAGVVTLTANVANGVTVWLDPIAFPAEA